MGDMFLCKQKIETLGIYEIYNGYDGGPYNGNRYLANAITSKDKRVLYSSQNDEKQADIPIDDKGVIIVFPTYADVGKDSEDEMIDTIKQTVDTLISRLNGISKDGNVSKDNPIRWTIGNYFSGRHITPKNGKKYDEKSLSAEIIGIPFETLCATIKENNDKFSRENVLIKDNYSRRVVLIDRKSNPE